jgi:beta-lactamase class A
VWALDSTMLNPPNLIGKVSHRTALEAMIIHSDNTGTDMCLKQAGPDNVRAFIAANGYTKSLIPNSTRVFFGYLLGAPDYLTFTWDEVQAAANEPFVNPPLNQVQTLASSADDLVAFYAKGLQGGFFTQPQSLAEFRRILSLGDVISLVPFPLGGSAFAKGGSIDVVGFHALCVAGGMVFVDRWVYFCFTINWDSPAETDPATAAAFAAYVRQTLDGVKSMLT